MGCGTRPQIILRREKNEMISRLAEGGVACVLRRGGVTTKSAIFSLPVGLSYSAYLLRIRSSPMPLSGIASLLNP